MWLAYLMRSISVVAADGTPVERRDIDYIGSDQAVVLAEMINTQRLSVAMLRADERHLPATRVAAISVDLIHRQP